MALSDLGDALRTPPFVAMGRTSKAHHGADWIGSRCMDYGDDFATFYDHHWREFGATVAPLVVEWAQGAGLGPGHVLDLCCGTGASSYAFAEAGWRVTGIDVSASMLAIADQRNPSPDRVRFMCGDITCLPAMEQLHADLTICVYDSFNHLPDMNAVRHAFTEAARHTRPQGWFVFDLNTTAALRSWQDTHELIDDDEGTLIATGSFNDADQSAQLDILGYRKLADGSYRRFRTTQVEHAFSDAEIRNALAETGWKMIRTTTFRKLNMQVEPTPEARRIVYMAQRNE